MTLTATIIDSREPAHIQSLKFGGVPTLINTLDSGDLWASCADGEMLIVERKTPNDLLGSIKDNRLFLQVAAMREKSSFAYLIITGLLGDTLDGHVSISNRTTGWRYDDVQAALLSVQECGVGVLFARSDQDYEQAVIRLAKRERSKERVLEPRAVSRIMTPQEQILCALPGIGLERAQTLNQEFEGRVCDALAWLTWLGGSLEIAGIGTGTKNGVRRAMGLELGEQLEVLQEREFPTLKRQIEEMEKAQ